jgi:succinate-semialdehyde dehydrogenase/glutarate-semialdehyde dehydrogenase
MAWQDFIRDRAFINGTWTGAQNKATFPVINPANGSHLADVPDMGAADADAAVAAAFAAMPAWRGLLARERAVLLRAWCDLIQQNAADLAALLSAEQGKPLREAQGEMIATWRNVEWYAEEAKRIYGDTIPTHKKDARVIVTREPVGVVAAITPWNFPASMITRKIAPALAAGCTVVLKPAEDTPLSALALAALAERAGFPPGVINVITTSLKNVAAVGRVLTTDERVRKITFTGSTEVGKILMAQGSGTVKKISLELGGNAPFIVFNSADLERAVEGAVASKFRNAGQTCICANRIFVQSGLYDSFVEKFTARVKTLRVGPGDDEKSDIGPLINAQAIAKVKDHIHDALAKGATVMAGGDMHESGGLFFQPTIIAPVPKNAKVFAEETFGPLAAIFKFETEAEAIALANDTRYGLAAYCYTNDLGQAFRVSESLEYGMVGVNESLLATESAPFGGVKESGLGREGGYHGIEDYTVVKYTLFGGL